MFDDINGRAASSAQPIARNTNIGFNLDEDFPCELRKRPEPAPPGRIRIGAALTAVISTRSSEAHVAGAPAAPNKKVLRRMPGNLSQCNRARIWKWSK